MNPGERKNLAVLLIASALVAGVATPARATFHLWDFAEVYSNSDGTIQFIELATGSTSQHLLTGRVVEAVANGNIFVFPNNLPSSSTANRRFLMATACFAALPGVPQPDFIIPDNFVATAGDTLRLRSSATGTIWDTFSFSLGALPLNCVDSLICATHAGSSCTSTATAVNSPTNFANQSGSVTPPSGDLDGDCKVNAADLAILLGSWGPCADCPPDLDGDGIVGAADLAMLLGQWFPC